MTKANGANKGYFQAPLSQVLVARQGELLHSHTTPIIGFVDNVDLSSKYEQLGSGVFVSIGNVYGILTARHVSRQIRDYDGIALPITQGIQKFVIKKEHLAILETDESQLEGIGPDLGFIRLGASDVGNVKAHKVFCNLETQLKLISHHKPTLIEGIWYACGAPHEQSTIKPGNEAIGRIHTYKTYSCELRPDKEFSKNGFDYLDVKYKYPEYQFSPLSFGGVSGGGIWQVLVGLDKNGATVTDSRILSGIIFYQSAFEDKARILRGHFRDSIYKNFYAEISKNFPI